MGVGGDKGQGWDTFIKPFTNDGVLQITSPMKNILPLLLAAALGSAATYFIMDSKQAPAPAAKAVKAAPRVAGGNTSAEQPAVAPGTDAQRKSPGGFTSGTKGKSSGWLPEEIPGVSAEQFTKCRTALMSTFRNETVRAAFTKVNEIRKELENATDEEKKNIEADIAEASKEARQAQKAAITAADPDITDETVDKVLDAMDEMRKLRMAQGGTKGGKGK